jgi:hypothetical protein
VITLSRENKELNDSNEQLRRQLMDIGTKYPNIVPLNAIMTGGSTSATMFDPNAVAGGMGIAAPGAAAPPMQPMMMGMMPMQMMGMMPGMVPMQIPMPNTTSVAAPAPQPAPAAQPVDAPAPESTKEV